MWMIQTGDCFRFAFEALLANRIRRQVSGKNFDGNGPVQARITSTVDFAHPARTQRRNKLVWPKSGAGGQCHNGEDYISLSKRLRELLL
jgi:hypothetical protein